MVSSFSFGSQKIRRLIKSLRKRKKEKERKEERRKKRLNVKSSRNFQNGREERGLASRFEKIVLFMSMRV